MRVPGRNQFTSMRATRPRADRVRSAHEAMLALLSRAREPAPLRSHADSGPDAHGVELLHPLPRPPVVRRLLRPPAERLLGYLEEDPAGRTAVFERALQDDLVAARPRDERQDDAPRGSDPCRAPRVDRGVVEAQRRSIFPVVLPSSGAIRPA